jgi:citrate/tricarballylate utilization protein
MQESDVVLEARREMEICNACRYCESYCAVFPAMELRREFIKTDLDYLANLCHNCRGCFYACQYAPPHEFNINLPRVFAELRMETYREYAWPGSLARLFHRNGLVMSIALIVSISLVLIASMMMNNDSVLYASHTGAGAFYQIIPKGVMIGVAGLTFGFSLLAMAVGFVRFWRSAGSPGWPSAKSIAIGIHDVLSLKNLGGGGHGCNDIDEDLSTTKRRLHHCLFYGFFLCVAATTIAWIYDRFLGLEAPYSFFSWPVMLGTIGGIGMLIGTGGLFCLKVVGDREPENPEQMGSDNALLTTLFLTALTGLVLLALRETPAMGILLAIHLGCVLAFFLTMPYSRFVHGIYRTAALIRNAAER